MASSSEKNRFISTDGDIKIYNFQTSNLIMIWEANYYGLILAVLFGSQ